MSRSVKSTNFGSFQNFSTGGLAWAAITNGLGGVAAPATGGSSNPAFGSIQPVRAVEITNRKCELNALARVSDDRYCDKYFVCSSGKYVGLFCPLGMAFEYGLQECRLKLEVDCSKRPLFGKSFYLGRLRLRPLVTQPITVLA